MNLSELLPAIKEELVNIVGSRNVVDEPATLNEYSRDCSFEKPSRPLLVIHPENAEQVQAVVSLANRSKVPLVPISSGPPRFHGDTIPSHGGIIIDLAKMKRVLRIDQRNRCVMIEPGVTFAELIPQLTARGLRLTSPLLPRASKSVVTSCLEREPTLIPKYQYDFVDPLLTMEVVFGTGDIFRTGSASGPGPFEELKTDKVNPWGPAQNDFMRFVSGAQGTFGIVTWAIRKVEVLPKLQKLFFVHSKTIEPLLQLMTQLTGRRVGDECLALNNHNLAAILAGDWQVEFNHLREALPQWTALVCIAGYERRPEQRVEIQETYLFEIAKGLALEPNVTLQGAPGTEEKILQLLSSPWTNEPYWKLRYKGSCHDILFLTPLQNASALITVMRESAAQYAYKQADIGYYIQPVVQGHGCHCEVNLPYDSSNTKETETVEKLSLQASEILMKHGAFFSRPHGEVADIVYRRYGEGTIALQKLKNIFDPNHILNRGRLCF